MIQNIFYLPYNKVNVVCQCKEFIDLKLRNNEKKVLNTLNKDKNRVTIRYNITFIKIYYCIFNEKIMNDF